MGLSRCDIKNNIKDDNYLFQNNKVIALVGNPNVGKSTIFNSLTGLKQHTGNWTGKTVELKAGYYTYNNKEYTIIDLPGTYSLFSSSKEEDITRDFICFNKHDLTIIVIDATSIERNLNLTTQILETNDNVIICVNLMDEAKNKKIKIDLNKLSKKLKVPVIGTCANDKKCINKLMKQIELSLIDANRNENVITYNKVIENVINKMNITLNKYTNLINARFLSIKLLSKYKNFNEKIFKYLNIKEKGIKEINYVIGMCHNYLKSNNIYDLQDNIIKEVIKKNNLLYEKVVFYDKKENFKVDKILSSKYFSIPIMIMFLSFILWLTISGANYPSNLLSKLLFCINNYIYKFLSNTIIPDVITDMLVNGILKTLAWVTSVMLPPMAIFFPLFTLLEDCGFLPRIAFNLDKLFNRAKCHGKQSLTMCMGLGCNACGVTGCRIIDSKKDRLIAIATNALIPCNGRFPSLIAIIAMFFAIGNFSGIKSSIILTLLIIISVLTTLLVSFILSKTLLKKESSSFILEIPPFRKPKISKVIINSIFDRTIFVLIRAITVAAPFGLIIWLMANINLNGVSILKICTTTLDPIANIFGIDGTILMALLLGFPANEIVIPIMLMCYLNKSTLIDYSNLSELKRLLVANGWTIKTAICTLFLILFHFPCSTTLLTIKKETKSNFWTLISFIIPTFIGLLICFLINLVFK